MEKPDSVVNKIVRKKLEFSQKDNTISSGRGILLKEVVVNGEFTSPQKNEMTENYGKASTTFYNADIPGKMQIVVEAITEKGEIGYKQITYDVKDLKVLKDNK